MLLAADGLKRFEFILDLFLNYSTVTDCELSFRPKKLFMLLM